MNAIAERFIGSVRREALDYFLIINEKQVMNIISRYIEYYNFKRSHQGIGLSVPKGYIREGKGEIVSEPVLGGLHHHYERRIA